MHLPYLRMTIASMLVWMLAMTPGAIGQQSPDQEEIPDGPTIGLERLAGGFAVPVTMRVDPRDEDTFLVADQIGVVRVVEGGEVREEPFLDLRDQIVDISADYDERGLLGLALHPDFETDGRFFVYYSAPLRDEAPDGWDHTSRVSEFRTDDDGNADLESERIILQVDQPQGNHNAGQITFGPDGYLYIPLGDGGNAADVGLGHVEGGNAQDITSLLGSILRIDVGTGEGDEPYTVPDDNPFVGENEGAEEIYAYGLRNPYGLAFESGGEGRLLSADAGQALYEEVNLIESGNNYGWNIREGSHCFDPDNPSQSPEECPEEGPRGEELVPPIVEYPRGENTGSVIVAARYYTGDAIDDLDGRIVLGDYARDRNEPDGVLYVAEADGTGDPGDVQRLVVGTELEGADQGDIGRWVVGLGEDDAGELYVLTTRSGGPAGDTGEIFQIVSVEDSDTPPGGDQDGDEGDDAAGGIPLWVWIVGAVALVGVIIAVARFGRKTT